VFDKSARPARAELSDTTCEESLNLPAVPSGRIRALPVRKSAPPGCAVSARFLHGAALRGPAAAYVAGPRKKSAPGSGFGGKKR